jgi:uncharacterized membrane protein
MTLVMILILVLGLLLWSVAHLFKRLAPEVRARMGESGKGVVALALLVAIVLMVIGYRGWDSGVFLWYGNAALTGINNLLMVVAVYLFAASGMKTRITRVIRHPQLTAVKVWALAHLLVNGDLESLVLFGGLLAWAVVAVILINRAQPTWTKPAPAPVGKEIGALVGAVVVTVAIGYAHVWFGLSPFGG